jgi:imidazole glycerol-phosphate synthase subunit HisH
VTDLTGGTVLIDTGSGNLHSAFKAFARMAAETATGEVRLSAEPADITGAARLVLPGDGAFPACRADLAHLPGVEAALRSAVEQRRVPVLGICVGMQLLATRGLEFRPTEGLGWIAGEVGPISVAADPGLKIPHMGWNDLVIDRPHPLLTGIVTGDHAYFVHSFAMRLADPGDRLAHADYGGPVTAIVARGNVAGTQFHPEKSQKTGMRLIANFLRWAPAPESA